MKTEIKLEGNEMKSFKKKMIIRAALFPIVFGAFLLIPAGTFLFWHVYVYMTIIILPMGFVIFYFLKNDPEFLIRRMKFKEKETQQKKIVLVTTIVFMTSFIIPGFDFRYGWSNIHVFLVVFADCLVLASYIFIILVFKENSFASRVIEVDKNQTVISTGSYSIVRHPMYSGVLIMYLATPIALGSYWALIPLILLPIALMLRILNEEKVLSEQLAGYKEYCIKVKYRMIPFVW